MNIKELIDQAKERAEKQLKLAKQIEAAEYKIELVKEGKICFFVGGVGPVQIDEVVDQENLDVIRELGLVAIMNFREDKSEELKKLLGIKKPATINPEFEQAVKEMEQQSKPKPVADPLEEKLAEILQKEEERLGKTDIPKSEMLEQHLEEIIQMYKFDGCTVQAVADKFSVKKSYVNNFLKKHNLFRVKQVDPSFADADRVNGKERP